MIQNPLASLPVILTMIAKFMQHVSTKDVLLIA